MTSHPDRRARTLAQCPPVADNGWTPPGPGSADARIDLKLWVWRAQRAMAAPGGGAARERLAVFADRRPDLWAGTVQDGVARGFQVALEEAVSLAPEPAETETGTEPEDPLRVQEFVQPALRRKKDILVASGGARVRYSRKGGLLFVDRQNDVHTEDCVRFEDRSDVGTLDGFEARIDERARIFSPAFLAPVLLRQGPARDLLVLEGRLGRGPRGYPCRITFEGRKGERFVRMTVGVENRHADHRLRVRFLGFPGVPYLRQHCTSTWEEVVNDAGGFQAATLVRACGRLLVDDRTVPVPGAQCRGWIEHHFELGLS